MGEQTGISWADHTLNPIIGCTKVSPGCHHCYAEDLAVNRMKLDVWGTGKPRKPASENMWKMPLTWYRRAVRDGVRRRVFCASMADVFEDHKDWQDPRERLWRLIGTTAGLPGPDAPGLDWLLLTKRPENVFRMAPEPWFSRGQRNVWLGFSAENQHWLEVRLAHAKNWRDLGWKGVIFVSYEPALGPIDIQAALDLVGWTGPGRLIDWLIGGAETGPQRRPYDEMWARSARDQCKTLGTAFWYKQGSHLRPGHHDTLDGAEIKEFPELVVPP